MEDLWPTAVMSIFSIHPCVTSASHFNSCSGQGILFGLRIFGNNWIVDGKKRKIDVVLYFCFKKLKQVNFPNVVIGLFLFSLSLVAEVEVSGS